MKTLVVGDLHTKLPILERVIAKSKKYDKVIFLGDYVDEWGTSPEYSIYLLKKIVEFKKSNPDKVILLLGNHDLSEWQDGDFTCSGFNHITHELVSDFFNENEQHFQIAYAQDNILFTHAGLTSNWCRDYKIEDGLSAEEYANLLNLALQERFGYNYHYLFKALSAVGPARGGFCAPSPIWADESELIANPIKCNQIVGHTPERHILMLETEDGYKLAFCDTFSLYSDYSPIGDQTMLEIKGDNWKVVNL